jgi:hypothetical protein
MAQINIMTDAKDSIGISSNFRRVRFSLTPRPAPRVNQTQFKCVAIFARRELMG